MAHAILGKPVYWVSCYRTQGVLVDSGCARARPALVKFLRERPIDAALTTHEHEDHVGNHATLHDAGCACVVAPPRAMDILERGAPRLPFYRWITWGAHETAPGAVAARDGMTVGERSWRVLETPGHSSDHVVYLDERDNAVYTGDAFLGRLKAVRAKEDVPLQMRSVRRIAEMDPAVLYPAHGPILERPRAKLLDVADHFDRLREKALALKEKGHSPRRIRQELMGPEPFLTYFSQGAFSAENLVRSLLR